MYHCREDFNPTLVQLEVIIFSIITKLKDQFQSHIGAIRRTIWSSVLVAAKPHFNPTLVQLED